MPKTHNSKLNVAGKKPRLLLLCLGRIPSFEDDLKILSRHYDVRYFSFRAYRYRTRFGRLGGSLKCGWKQLLWLLQEIPKAKVVYGYFADYHMVLPTLFARLRNVPVVVRLGGFDVYALSELGYGVWLSRWRAPLARWVVQKASLLIAVLPTLLETKSRFPRWPETHVDGLLTHVPDLKTPFELVPMGFDGGKWPMGPLERKPIVTTVAVVDDERTFCVKGLDVFVETARKMPDVHFRIVGVSGRFKKTLVERHALPRNVQTLPSRSRAELQEVYAETSVYVQLSRTEAFGRVVAEAMLCGCIPVVSQVGGLPALVGDPEFVVGSPEPKTIAQSIRKMLARGPEIRQQMRERIVVDFSLRQRERSLLSALAMLCEPIKSAD